MSKKLINETRRHPTASGMAIGRRVDAETAPSEKILTETDERLKKLVQLQLMTDVNLGTLSSRYKTFTPSAVFKPTLYSVAGTRSLGEYSGLESVDERVQALRDCNLSNEEIRVWLERTAENPPSKRLKLGRHPDYDEAFMRDIEQKLADRERRLSQQSEFSAAQEVSRHKLELEQALNQGRSDKLKLSSLLLKPMTSKTADDDPVSQLKELSHEIANRATAFPDYGPAYPNPWVPVIDRLPVEPGFIGPSLKDEDMDISDERIRNNRLTMAEIRQLPKFSSYEPGNPSETLYVKNIGSTVKQGQLQHLFTRFQIPGEPPITCQLMAGRMRGQAFVYCHDKATAARALHSVCGFKLKGRPMVIMFAKRKESEYWGGELKEDDRKDEQKDSEQKSNEQKDSEQKNDEQKDSEQKNDEQKDSERKDGERKHNEHELDERSSDQQKSN